MERLTYFKNGHWRMKINGCQYSGEFIDRLAAYEDSGLTPEKCAVYGKADREGRYIVLRDAEEEGVARLRELALADKEGRVVVLPCEVGSTVYTEFCDEIVEKRIGQFHVNGYTEPRLWADIDCDWTSTQCVRWDLAIGKTIFLTRAEAEEKLKEVQKGD
jgi:hypothetical protein|nr:MAG TPA: hypothetical protein [Caudoviricetes sp.]